MIIKKILKAAIKFNLYFLRSLAKLFNVEFDAFYFRGQITDKRLNSHLLTDKASASGMYTSYLPDRYSSTLPVYRQQTNFFEYAGLNQWLQGNYENNTGDIGRFFFLNLCIDYLLEDQIIGNTAELGVYKGNSAFLMAKYASTVKTKCYLFDTFEGFDKRDVTGLDAGVQADAFSDTSLAYVKQNVGYDNSTIYVKGYFPESLEQVGEIADFSLVHIDCDLEKPIAAALNYFYPKMLKGGFLILHDHSSLYWPGAKKAIDDFFADKPEYVVPVPDKSGTCVVRKM